MFAVGLLPADLGTRRTAQFKEAHTSEYFGERGVLSLFGKLLASTYKEPKGVTLLHFSSGLLFRFP